MNQRISASTFLLGMALLVLLQQPIFAYCSCAERFSLGDVDCPSEDECCGCEEEETPANDCHKKLILEVDDHLWDDPNPANPPLLFVEKTALPDFEDRAHPLPFLPTSRPPPPDEPLFLRYENWRI